MGRDRALFSAASLGQLGVLKELIAGGADPNGHKDEVRVIAEAGRASPTSFYATASHRVSAVRVSDRIVKFASARVVWFGASSSRRVVAARIGRRRRRRLNRPSRSPELL